MSRPSRSELGKILRLEERIGYQFTNVRIACTALHSHDGARAFQMAGDYELKAVLASIVHRRCPELGDDRYGLQECIARLVSNRVLGAACVERGIAVLAHIPESIFKEMECSAKRFYEVCADVLEAVAYAVRIDATASRRYYLVEELVERLMHGELIRTIEHHSNKDLPGLIERAKHELDLRVHRQKVAGEHRITLTFNWSHTFGNAKKMRRYFRHSDARAIDRRLYALVTSLLDQNEFYSKHPYALKRVRGGS